MPRWKCSAVSIAARLRASPSSSTPVPRRLSGLAIAWLALRQIGGQTGDALGGAEQVAETAILVLLAARLGQP